MPTIKKSKKEARLHDLLRRYTFIKDLKLHDRLFHRDGQRVQSREIERIRELGIPDVGSLVKHINGGPTMCVENLRVTAKGYIVNVTCSWWEQNEDGHQLLMDAFDYRVLKATLAIVR